VSEGLSDAALARRKLELEVAKLEKELEKMSLDIDKLRADIRNDARRTTYQMWGVAFGAVAAAAAIITATIALTKAFL
jgi:hypothetical protein